MTTSKTWRGTRLALAGCMALGAALATAGDGAAQDNYPNKPIHIIVGFAAGNGTDITARLLASRIEAKYGQPVIVENKTGAGGDLASNFVARSEPDGYTLLFGTTSMVISAATKPSQDYSPADDFEAVAVATTFPQVLTTSKAMGVTDLKAFAAKVKEKPGQYYYVSAGVGAISHAILAAFCEAAGLDMVHVPQKTSSAATLDLIADRAQLGTSSPQTLMGNADLVPLGVTSRERSRYFPDVPTISEAGYPEFSEQASWMSWQAMFAPKGTPRDILEKLNADLNEVLKEKDVSDRLTDLAQDNMGGMSLDDADKYIAEEQAAWKQAAEKLKLQVD